MQQWASVFLGATIGKVMGGNTDTALAGGTSARDAEMFNRQLHEKERAIARDKNYLEAFKNHVKKTENRDITDEEAILRTEKQILRWVNQDSNDGYTDEAVVSALGMKGENKQLGYKWDYRNYSQNNYNAYINNDIFSQYTSDAERIKLQNTKFGTKNSEIATRHQRGEEMALNVLDIASNFVYPNPASRSAIKGVMGNAIQGVKDLKPKVYGNDPLLAGVDIPLSSVNKGNNVPVNVMATKSHDTTVVTNTKVDNWIPNSNPNQLWSKGKLGEHFQKHGSEFNAKSSQEYSQMALNFSKKENRGNFIESVNNGFYYRFEPATNTILVGTISGGKIKTFYKWDGRANDAVINHLKTQGLIK